MRIQKKKKYTCPNFKNVYFKVVLLNILTSIFLLSGGKVFGQAADYAFSTSSGTFTAITGTVSTATGDDGTQTGISIGFTFNYCGTIYTTFNISTNGHIYFGSSTSYLNDLASTTHKPIIAPLWDDLFDDANSDVQYLTSGSSPNRILTVQWRNIRWNTYSGALQNFQLKLYETSNIIKFIYGSMSSPTSVCASIGINDQTGGSGRFLSVTPAVTPTVSGTLANNSISASTNLTTNLTYTFTPTSCYSPNSVTASSIAATTATISWTTPSPTPSSGYGYEVRTGGVAGSGASGLTTSGTTAAGIVTKDIIGLSPSTTYYVYVRSNCGNGDLSSWAAGTSFTTPCGIASLPYTQNFNASTSLPLCWTSDMSISSTHGASSSNGLYENLWSSATTCYGRTTQLGPITSYSRLTFDYRIVNYTSYPTTGTTLGASDKVEIQYSTDDVSYTTIYTINYTTHSNSAAFTNKQIDLSSLSGSNIYIKFKSTWGAGDYYLDIDNVIVENTSTPGTSTLSAGAGSEPATISSLTNTQGASSLNFDFKYTDDGITPATNTTATQISKIVINQGTGNDITSWSDAILGAELSDGSNNMTGTVNATNITFSSISNGIGNLGYIADDAEKTYTLKIWLKNPLGGTLPADIDGKNFVFNVNNSSFTFAVGGLAACQAVSSASTDNTVDVVATKLIFQTNKPPSSATCNTNFNVSVDAVDANGNRDINITAPVALSLNSGTGTLSSASGLTKSLSSGTYAWTDIKYTPGETIKIQATAGSLTQATSGNITVSCGAPGSAPIFYNTGSTSQLAFNNSYINDNTPNFRLSGTHTTNFNRFRIEVNTNSTFTGTSYNQTFSGNYVSGTQYDLECTALNNSWSPVNNSTYYVRADISSDGGSTWSSKSSALYSFTYKTSGEPEWYQISAIQLATTTKTEDIIPNIPLNRSFETGSLDNWTETNTAPTNCSGSSRSISNATDVSYSCFIQHGDGTTSATWTTGMYTQRSQSVSFNNISQIKLDCKTHCDQTSSGWEKSYIKIGTNKTYIDADVSGTTIDSYLNFTLNTSSYSGNQSLAMGLEFTHSEATGDYIARHAYFDNIRFYGITTEVAQTEGVLFSSFLDGTTWGNASWTTSGVNGSANIQLEYWNGSAWVLIPDGALSGNSSGFSSSPKDISALNTSTYSRIRLRINYAYFNGRPSLASWNISPTFGNQLSDIISSSGETDNIQYENYQTASSLTTGNAVKIGTFTIRDGGTSSPDDDDKATTLTDIVFSVENHANIRAMAIFDGSSNLKEVTSITASTAFTTISGLIAPDNGTKSFDVYATFKSSVTDNQQIKLTINSATSSTSGSVFAATDAGGAITSIIGNKNRIIVTATKLVFETNLPPAIVPIDTEFPVKVKGVDANGNFDENATNTVSLSTYTPGTGILSSATNLTQSLSSGVYQWNDISYNTVQEFKIRASSSGLTDGISILINCINIPGNFNITAPLNATTCNGNITISWVSSTNAISYDLYYTTGFASDPMTCVSPIVGVTSPYTYNASNPLTLYKFQVLAINPVGQTWSTNIGTDSTRTGSSWIGGTNTNWSTVSNWCGNAVPNLTSDVIIFPGTLFLPSLSAESNAKNLTIESGVTLNTGTFTLNVYGNYTNNGTLLGDGTVKFTGTSATQTINNGSNSFYNLSVDKPTGSAVLNTNDITVRNDLTITNGTLDANNLDITLRKNWTDNGIFVPGTGLVTFNGTGASTINRTSKELVIFSDGFENGNQGWTMQSIAANTDWRIQSTGAPYAGSYNMSTYDISASVANNYCRTCGNFSLDFYRDMDLTDYSSATLYFYWKSTDDTSPFGKVIMDGSVLGILSNSTAWNAASYSVNSYCGNGLKNLAFRFYIASSAKPSSFVSIDNVEIRGFSNIEVFNKIKIEKTGTGSVSLNSSIKTIDNLEITTGTLNTSGKFVKCQKDFINNGTFNHNNGEVQFIGNQAQNITGTSNTVFYKFTKNSTGKLIIGDNSVATTIEVQNSFKWTNNSDKIIVGNGVANTFKINDNLYIQQNCILETQNGATVSVLKNYTDYGIYTPNDGIVKFHGAENSNIIREPAYVIYSQDFETGAASGWTLGIDVDESGWSVQSGYGHNSDYDLAMYDIHWAMTHDYNWSTYQGRIVTIDAVSPVINLSAYSVASIKFWYRIMGDNNDYGQVLVKVNGVENLIMDNMRNKALWTESNTFDISTIAGGQSSVQLIFRFKMDGTNGGDAPGLCIDDIVITSTSILTETFNTIIVDKTSSKIVALRCPVDINSDVTINQGTFDCGGFSFPVGGNWSTIGTSTFMHRNNTITFDGNNQFKPQSINIGTSSFYKVILNNPSGTATLSTNRLKVESNLTLTSGTLDATNQNIEIGGHWLNNGAIFNPQIQQVKFYGSANQNITSLNGVVNPFYTIEMNKDGSLILQDSLTLDKDFKLVKGLLDVNTNKNIRLKGDWLIGNGTTSGTFNPGTAMVTFNGSSPQIINKRTNGTVNLNDFTFYDLKIDGTNVTLWLKSSHYKINTNNLYIVKDKVLNIEGQP